MYLNRLIFFHDQRFRAIPSKSAPPIKEMAIKYRDNIVHYQYFRGNIKMLEKGGLLTPVCQYERFRNRPLRLINRDPLWLPIN